jgi:hypothetical protein
MGIHSWKVHCKVIDYPDFEGNPLGMLRYVKSREQIERVMGSMHFKIQELVRAEVGDKMEKDLETQEKDELKGIFKIKITPQIKHLMKLSKSIFDKTKFDKQKEEEAELKEIEENFPSYMEEYDRDKLFEKNELENYDYEEPEDDPDMMKNSFRNIKEKKQCFYKLLKTYQALMQKRDSILNQNDDIKTISDSTVDSEKFKEISSLLESTFPKQYQSKLEHSLTKNEEKILNLRLMKSFESLIEESKLKETKITLKVASKDFPENYNFYEDPYFTEIKTVYEPLSKIIEKCNLLLEEWGEHPVLQDIVAY